ncbi:MAG: RNA polymerase sigma factor SigA [Verrucomicrobia bacterium ADurb.Bin474]|nr:MAG: RNA polymerase sigma factor SigA [Verrucomicrobia bacterium ADurb.Bin474]
MPTRTVNTDKTSDSPEGRESADSRSALSRVADTELTGMAERISVSRNIGPSRSTFGDAFADEEVDVKTLPSSEKSSIKIYLQEIAKTPLLTHEEEVSLASRIRKGDQEARNQMISANLRLVVKIAYDYNHFGLPLLDLISEGNIGLIKAVERFDPEKGGKLSTYAAWWIKQSIKRALANQSKTIRLPVHLVDKIANMRRITQRLTEELGREPADDEIAIEMGIPVNKVAHLKSVSVRPASLDAPIGDDEDTEYGDLVGDENAINPFDKLRSKTLLYDMNHMLESIDPREAEIIRMRFGLDGEKPRTLEEVGQAFDITRERVRQLQNMAISRMRKIMTSNERQRTLEEVKQEELERKRMEVLHEFFESKRNKSDS